ncbi:MAG: PEP-CTERM sorting domain-containing protein, partial [Symploca sp. SIO1B1]|nr:PEP-CTERM sorting domain-containing protein [Symploca sp. SIO1B1]
NSTSVPEPGVVLGLLGISTWMLKKSVRKQPLVEEREVA